LESVGNKDTLARVRPLLSDPDPGCRELAYQSLHTLAQRLELFDSPELAESIA
jgi:hypothetical protein